jgi:hypothetical protein
MTEQTSPTPGEDLEYDLAHDAVEPQQPVPGPAPRTQVATETAGYDGDYGYDLAHDIPPQG